MAAAVRAVGEGFLRPNYEELPIDVQYTKLLDWLVDRKKVVWDWSPRSNTVQDRVATAVASLPKDDSVLNEILAEQPLNYFSCERILARLKEMASATSFLGQFTSESVREWTQIVRGYERDGVYLGEVAAEIQRAGMYQLPAMKKQLASYHQQLKDLARRDSEYRASSAAAKAKFQSICRDWGIQGADVKAELCATVGELPALLDEAAAAVSGADFGDLAAFYRDFAVFVADGNAKVAAAAALPVLSFVRAHGNAPLALFLGEDAPSAAAAAAAPPAAAAAMNEAAAAMGKAAAAMDEVDADAPVMIDWDVAVGEDGDGSSDGEVAINWDVDLDIAVVNAGGAADLPVVGLEIEVAQAGQLGATTLLDSDEHRAMLVDELTELRAFVTQRLVEVAKGTAIVTMMRGAPASLQRESTSLLKAYEAARTRARAIDEKLTNERVARLLQLRSSPAYVDQLSASLEQVRRTSESMLARVDANQERREQLNAQITATTEKIERLAEHTRTLIRNTERAISKLYNNRPVNIIGDIRS